MTDTEIHVMFESTLLTHMQNNTTETNCKILKFHWSTDKVEMMKVVSTGNNEQGDGDETRGETRSWTEYELSKCTWFWLSWWIVDESPGRGDNSLGCVLEFPAEFLVTRRRWNLGKRTECGGWAGRAVDNQSFWRTDCTEVGMRKKLKTPLRLRQRRSNSLFLLTLFLDELQWAAPGKYSRQAPPPALIDSSIDIMYVYTSWTAPAYWISWSRW